MSYRGKQLRPRDPKTGRLYRVIAPVPKLTYPPRALRKATLDNLTLIPGNLLPFKAQYQRIANALPAGEVLIILPSGDRPVRKTVQTVVDLVRAKGHKPRQMRGYIYLH
jgi:hypothetical protein